MIFEKDRSAEKLGEKIGYAFGYFLFSTVLFYMLTFSAKMPAGWSYFHILGIAVLIVLLGSAIKGFLR